MSVNSNNNTLLRYSLAALALLSTVAYLLIAYYFPIGINMNAPDDDTLFLNLAMELSRGNWLGEFSPRTLVKGPGYPLYLTMVSSSGLPLNLVNGLLHVSATALFALAVWHVSRSAWLAFGIYFVILLHPEMLRLGRLVRDGFYTDMVLLFLAAVMTAAYSARSVASTIIASSIAGLLLGLSWLTREEGIWLVPCILLIMLGVVIQRRYKHLFLTMITLLAAFSFIELGFRYVNWLKYDTWIGVETKHGAYTGALEALYSVESGDEGAYLPLPASERAQIYRVSPSMASLKGFFEPGKWRWQSGCEFYPETCGDIAAGWVSWALRGSAGHYGYYDTPEKSVALYDSVAQEIEAACQSGELQCNRRPLGSLPPMVNAQWRALPGLFATGAISILRGVSVDKRTHSTIGTESEINQALGFLNSPVHRQQGPNKDASTLSGLYYDAKTPSSWIEPGVSDSDGRPMKFQVARYASPELKARYGSLAANQRFVVQSQCVRDCQFSFRAGDGDLFEVNVEELIESGGKRFMGDRAALVIDRVSVVAALKETRPGVIRATQVVAVLVEAYGVLMPILSILGLAAFAMTLTFSVSRRVFSQSFILSSVLWCLIASRLVILALVDASSFPAFTSLYLLPAWVLLPAAALLSLFSVSELRDNRAKPAQSGFPLS